MSGSCYSGKSGSCGCLGFFLVVVFVIPVMFAVSFVKNRVLRTESSTKSSTLPESFAGFTLGASPNNYSGRLNDGDAFDLICDCGFREKRVYNLPEGETFEGSPCGGGVSFKNAGSNEAPLWQLYEVALYVDPCPENLEGLMIKKYGAPSNDDDLRSTWTASNCRLTLQKRTMTTNERGMVSLYSDEHGSKYESAQHSRMHKNWSNEKD